MNRLTRVAFVSFLVAAGLLLGAAPASANNFCAVVSGTLPDCTPANTSTGATTSVQAALNNAVSNIGPDRVIIGAGTFTAPGPSFAWNYSAGGTPGNDVEISGQGPSTILQPNGDPVPNYVLVISGTSLSTDSVHDLKVNIPSTAGTGVTGILVSSNSPTDVHDVTVTAPAPLAATVGVSLGSPGSVLRNSTIDIARFGVATQGTFGAVSQVATGSPVPVIRDSTVSADYGVAAGSFVSTTDEKLTVRGMRITATTGVTTNQGGHVTVDDSLIRLVPDAVAPSTYDSVGLSSFSFLGATAQLTGRHVTVIGGPGTRDVGVKSFSADNAANTDLLVQSSVLSNVETSLFRQAADGVATLGAEYSNYDPALTINTNTGGSGGSGILTQTPGNINVNPGFVSAAGGDFSLTSSSALIDKGDPAILLGNEPTTDLAGNPRIADGNGDGTARRDIGAFEFMPAPPAGDTTAPNTIAGKFKKKVKKGKSATFRFSSDDPTASFTCQYDNGSPKSCASPYTLKRLKKGKHVLMIEAFDQAGNHDASPVVDKFKVKGKKRKK